MASEEITISDLTPVSSVNDNDNLLIEDSTQTKRVTAHTLSEYIKEDISFDDLLDEEDAIVPVNKGGTGASTVEAARDALGLGNTSGALPVANGGTGASSAAGARSNLGLGSVATESIVPVSKGGTGKSSITSDTVLVGNGTSAPTERSIDTTSGGTANSNALITSGAVNSKVREMQSTFQDGVDTIYNAIVAEGVTPSASTPSACATGIASIRKNLVLISNNPDISISEYTFTAEVNAYYLLRVHTQRPMSVVDAYKYRVSSGANELSNQIFNYGGNDYIGQILYIKATSTTVTLSSASTVAIGRDIVLLKFT